MDFNKLTVGATHYLPVFNNGALFFTGDSHAVQGDGEVDGTAIEASLTATLQFIVHKGAGTAMRWPRAEDESNYYAMGLDLDLNKALQEAAAETVAFLRDRKGLSAADAYALASVAAVQAEPGLLVEALTAALDGCRKAREMAPAAAARFIVWSAQCASGLGRSWKFTTIGLDSVAGVGPGAPGAPASMPSICTGVRLPEVTHRPRPFQPAAASSMRPSSPLAKKPIG
jgi:hypothetical protein